MKKKPSPVEQPAEFHATTKKALKPVHYASTGAYSLLLEKLEAGELEIHHGKKKMEEVADQLVEAVLEDLKRTKGGE